MKKSMLLLTALSFAFIGGMVPSVSAQTIVTVYDESVSGDLDDEPLSPSFTLVAGVNRFLGTLETTPPSQQDNWLVVVPESHVITNINASGLPADDGGATFTGFWEFANATSRTGTLNLDFSPGLPAGEYTIRAGTGFNVAERSWVVDITVEKVDDPIDILIEDIESMALNDGVTHSLTGVLTQPRNGHGICGKLTAFSKIVANYLARGQLSPSQASQLTNSAQAIQISIGCDRISVNDVNALVLLDSKPR